MRSLKVPKIVYISRQKGESNGQKQLIIGKSSLIDYILSLATINKYLAISLNEKNLIKRMYGI